MPAKSKSRVTGKRSGSALIAPARSETFTLLCCASRTVHNPWADGECPVCRSYRQFFRSLRPPLDLFEDPHRFVQVCGFWVLDDNE